MKRNALSPEQRLIVAVDFKGTRSSVASDIATLASTLANTGVYLKFNSALFACGFDLIDIAHSYGLKVFADLKLNDIGETLATTGELLSVSKPELLTVMCSTGPAAIRKLKATLPDTELLGVTALTSLTEDDTKLMFSCSVEDAVRRFAFIGIDAGVDGLISSPHEAAMLRDVYGSGITINTPNIRPTWMEVIADDQNKNRAMTPGEAIRAGADRIVVGRPIIQHKDPLDAVKRTIAEIEEAVVVMHT